MQINANHIDGSIRFMEIGLEGAVWCHQAWPIGECRHASPEMPRASTYRYAGMEEVCDELFVE